MEVIRTERLVLRQLHAGDSAFIHELVNDADWLRYIGDRGVRTPDDARVYIESGPVASYAQNGFGLYCVARIEDGRAIGMCGLIKRDTLDDVDIGFAFLPPFRSQGFAYEAATATFEHARRQLGISRIVAIVSPDNEASMRLLEKLGLRMERELRLGDGNDVLLYAPAAN